MKPVGSRAAPVSTDKLTQAEIQRKLAGNSGQGQPQPLATRHLDPRFNPDEIEEMDSPHIGSQVKRFRVLLRKGYTCYLGERDAYEGPQTMYLSELEMKGQEHKFEPIGDSPVQSILSSGPAAIAPEMGSSIRRQKILQMAGELAALEAEEKLFLQDKATEAVTRDDTRTLSEPAQNPDADKLPMTTEDMGYQPQVKAGETYPPLEPTGQLHDGTLSGPAVNPCLRWSWGLSRAIHPQLRAGCHRPGDGLQHQASENLTDGGRTGSA